MKCKTEEVYVKTILSKSGIPGVDYCVNPYTGCAHACKYCYATFMKRFTGHAEPWGTFVDIKMNAPEVLRRQLKRAKTGHVMISSVTDPYQPAEAKYKITRKCLEVFSLFDFPVGILTKSPLVIRDIDVLSGLKDVEVGITLSTDNEKVRRIFEPNAPSIDSRIDALQKLHKAGINTYVFIGPVLPMNPDNLAGRIKPFINSVLIDRMNYINKTKILYRKYKLDKWLDRSFTDKAISRLLRKLSNKDISVIFNP